MKNINFISTILGLVFPVIGILLTVLYKSDNRITVLFFILFLRLQFFQDHQQLDVHCLFDLIMINRTN